MKISVTQEDIDCGVRKNTSCCPIARACLRAGLVEPSVFSCWVEWSHSSSNGTRTLFKKGLPARAVNFILEFDRGWFVYPFEFELETNS